MQPRLDQFPRCRVLSQEGYSIGGPVSMGQVTSGARAELNAAKPATSKLWISLPDLVLHRVHKVCRSVSSACPRSTNRDQL